MSTADQKAREGKRRKWTGIQEPKRPPVLWERLDTEGAKAFRAFRIYLDLGPGRSVLKAYRVHRGSETVKLSKVWSQWSRSHSWLKRAAVFDDHEARRRTKEIQQIREQARAEVGENAATLIRKLLDMAMGRKRCPAAVQLRAIRYALEYAGVSLPKTSRVELSGRDGAPLQVESKAEVVLTRERLEALSQDPEGLAALSTLAMKEAALLVEAHKRD